NPMDFFYLVQFHFTTSQNIQNIEVAKKGLVNEEKVALTNSLETLLDLIQENPNLSTYTEETVNKYLQVQTNAYEPYQNAFKLLKKADLTLDELQKEHQNVKKSIQDIQAAKKGLVLKGLVLNVAPMLEVKDAKIIQDDSFDLKGMIVSAEDKEDGDLKNEVKITDKGNFDNNKVGKYTITFNVTDNGGASTTKKAIVTVNPKMETLNEAPVITATDKTITVGDTFDPKAEVTASDKEDGDITGKLEVVKNEVDTTKAGVYEVTYKVTDSKGATCTKTITVTVKERKESTPSTDSRKKPNNGGDKTNRTGNPKTGDQTNVGLFTSLSAISLLGIAVLAVFKKKKALEHK
ncbi:MAG: immunoglobulin-like domain-containing protein, partial [Clostridium paraputrificum]